MVKVTKVWLRRAEGPNWDLGQYTVGTLEEADAILRRWALTAPEEGGGYDKVDFKVTWADGETYSGRYDMTHKDAHAADLGGHIRSAMEFYGGLHRSTHLTPEQYESHVATVEKRTGIPRSQYAPWIEKHQLMGEVPSTQQDADYKRGWDEGYKWVMKDRQAAYRWEREVYQQMDEPSWYDMGKADVIAEHRVAHWDR